MKKITLILIMNCYIIMPSDKTESSSNLDVHRKRFDRTPTPQDVSFGKQTKIPYLDNSSLLFNNRSKLHVINPADSKYQKFCVHRKIRTKEHNKYLAEIQPTIEQEVTSKPELGHHPLEIIENIDNWEQNEAAWLHFISVSIKIKEWIESLPSKHDPIDTTPPPVSICFHQNNGTVCPECTDDLLFIDNYLQTKDPE